jgi:uncharacterized membrane protein (Fun14 family)
MEKPSIVPSHSLTMNDMFSSTFLWGKVGAPFLIGLAVGFFIKKIARTALFIAGGVIVILFVAEYFGITQVSNINLGKAADNAATLTKSSGEYLMARLAMINFQGVSAVAGFFAGLKMG